MNDGFLSLLVHLFIFFILVGGWFKEDLDEVGWKEKNLFLFLTLALFSPFFSFNVANISITGAMLLYPVSAILLICNKGKKERFHLFAGGILTGTIVFFILEIFRIDPILLIIEPRMELGIFISILVGFLTLSLTSKWLMIALGMPMGWTLFLFYHDQEIPIKVLGSFYDVDALNFTFLLIFFIHGIYRTLYHLFVNKKRKHQQWDKGEQKGL